MRIARWLLFVLLIASPPVLHAQQPSTAAAAIQPASNPVQATAAPVSIANPRTPAEFFARARQLSDLEAAGVPFHLKATYVASGDTEFTGNGTIEEWWKSKDIWRKEATLGNYKYVAISNGGDPSYYITTQYVPLRLRQALDVVLIHIPPDIGQAKGWKKKRAKIGSMVLIGVGRGTLCGFKPTEALCPERYDFTNGGILRIHQDSGVSTFNNQFLPYQGQLIPRQIELGIQGQPVLTVNLSTLGPLGADNSSLFDVNTIPPGTAKYLLKPLMAKRSIDVKGLIEPKLIHYVDPLYPRDGRHTSGAVVIAASIDGNGNVREPFIYLSAGQLFDGAALQALHQYRFKPAKLGSQPVSANIRVAINFKIW